MTDENADSADIDQSWYRRLPWRRIASVLAVIVLLAVVIPFVVYAVPQVVGADHSFVVLSGSMQPTMHPGDVIVVESTSPAAIEKGDVITFHRAEESRPTTHRVVEVVTQDGDRGFETAGDYNDEPDPELVTSDQVVGKVLSFDGHLLVIPFIGRVIVFASTQTGFLLFAVLPIGLFVVNELWGIVASIRPGSEKLEGDQSIARTTSSETAEGAIAFSSNELRLGLLILVVFLAYSVWVAYSTLESWALGAVGAVGTATLLLAGLYVFGNTVTSDHSTVSRAGEDNEASEATTDRDPDVSERTPPAEKGESTRPSGDVTPVRESQHLDQSVGELRADDSSVLDSDGDSSPPRSGRPPGREHSTAHGGDQDD